MAKNKEVKITELSVTELNEKLVAGIEELKTKSFGHTVTPLQNPNEIKILRRGIARLKTELTARKS